MTCSNNDDEKKTKMKSVDDQIEIAAYQLNIVFVSWFLFRVWW